MSSLHHVRRVDDGRDVAPATPDQKVPAQRQGKARGTAPQGGTAADVPAEAGTGTGSLTARARAATTAAAGSTAAKTAVARTATARTAAAKAATAGAATARTAAARATTAAKTAAAATVAGRKAAAKKAAPQPAATAEPQATATAEPRPTPAPRPRPVVAPPESIDVAELPEAPTAPATPAEQIDASAPVECIDVPAPVALVVPAFVDEALVGLPAEQAEVVPAATDGAPRKGGRHRAPVIHRRPAFYLAAGLVGALTIGALVDTDPTAQADTTSVSVAQQLGIDGGSSDTLSQGDSTRLLQELVVSRNERDSAQLAAADVQAAADAQAVTDLQTLAAAAAEAARPKAVLPVNGARLSSGFGSRWGTVHAGIDLAAPMDTPEYAAMDGVVLEAGPASGFGLAVYIQHDNGDVTVYGHMDKILVEPGQLVRAGDTIALLGNRGESTGPHLHFEVHVGGLNGTKIDPLPWLRARGVQI